MEGPGAERAAEVRAAECGDGGMRRWFEGRCCDVDPPGAGSPAPRDFEEHRWDWVGRLEGWSDADLGGRDIDDEVAEGDAAGPSGEDGTEVLEAGAVDGGFALEEGCLAFDDERECFAGQIGEYGDGEDGTEGSALFGAGFVGAVFDEGEGFACAGGEADEGLLDGWVDGFEAREELCPEAVAQERRVAVGGVGPWVQLECGAHGEGILASKGQKGAEHDLSRAAGEWAGGKHAAEPAHAGPAEEVEQDGFGLVVGSMAGYDCIAAFFLGGEGEELVAHGSCGFFDAPVLARRDLADGAFSGDGFEAECGGVLTDEFAVGCGFGAKLVVEVGDEQLVPELLAQREEEVEAREGIGAAGDCDEEAATASEEVLGFGEAGDSLEGGTDGRR